jgi:hypothetical protein
MTSTISMRSIKSSIKALGILPAMVVVYDRT